MQKKKKITHAITLDIFSVQYFDKRIRICNQDADKYLKSKQQISEWTIITKDLLKIIQSLGKVVVRSGNYAYRWKLDFFFKSETHCCDL